MSTSSEAELRCPAGPQKLLAKVISDGEQPTYVKPDNLIELACLDCKRARARLGQECQRVLHRYNILGELVETLVVELLGRVLMSTSTEDSAESADMRYLESEYGSDEYRMQDYMDDLAWLERVRRSS